MSSRNPFSNQKPLWGDWLVLGCALIFVAFTFYRFWQNETAGKLVIRQGDRIFASYSLDQNRTLDIHGPLGNSRVEIAHGKVRFSSAPCTNQYCVHHGWLSKVGQVAICLPNQVSLELIGAKRPYDSLNY
jgi:hypothetical protein